MSTFDAKCKECGSTFECPFERIGESAECPSCSRLIELIPQVKFNEKVKTTGQPSRKSVAPFITILLVVLGTVFFWFSKAKEAPHTSSSKNEATGKLTKIPSEKEVEENSEKSPLNSSKPFKKTIDYNSLKNEILKYNCAPGKGLAFLITKNMVVMKKPYSRERNFQELHIPTTYGYRITYGQLVLHNGGNAYMMINNGEMDLPPLGMNTTLKRELASISKDPSRNSKYQVIDASSPFKDTYSDRFFFSHDRKICLLETNKNKYFIINKKSVEYVQKYSNALPEEDYFFADYDTYTKEYKGDKLIKDLKKENYKSNTPDIQYSATSSDEDTFILFPVAPDIFITFSQSDINRNLYIDGKHPLLKVYEERNNYLNYELYKSASSFRAKKFYKFNKSMKLYDKLKLSYLKNNKLETKEVTVNDISTMKVMNDLEVGKQYDQRGKLGPFPVKVFYNYDLNLKTLSNKANIIASSGDILTAFGTLCIPPVMARTIEQVIKDHSIGNKTHKYDEIKYSPPKFPHIHSSTNGITIIRNTFIDWKTNKTYEVQHKLINVKRSQNNDYICFQHDSKRDTLTASSYKTGKTFKTLPFRRTSVYGFSKDRRYLLQNVALGTLELLDFNTMTSSTINMVGRPDVILWSAKEQCFHLVKTWKGQKTFYKFKNNRLIEVSNQSNQLTKKGLDKNNSPMLSSKNKLSNRLYKFGSVYIVFDEIKQRPIYSIFGYEHSYLYDCYIEDNSIILLSSETIKKIPLSSLKEIQQ